MDKCGACAHAKPIPGNLMQRVCRGGPPQIIVLPGPQGIVMQTAFPNVGVGDEACGAFKRKLVLPDPIADQEMVEVE